VNDRNFVFYFSLSFFSSALSETFKPSFMQIIRFNEYGAWKGGGRLKKRGPKANRRCQSHESQVYLPSFFCPQQLARSSHARFLFHFLYYESAASGQNLVKSVTGFHVCHCSAVARVTVSVAASRQTDRGGL